jgi:PAS domain-containing protein
LLQFILISLGLRRKILAVAIVPTVLLVAAFLVVFAVQRSRLAGKVERGMGQLAEENLARAARDLRTLCEATHRELSQQVPRSLRVAHDQLDRIGTLSLARETVTWRALNQLDGTATDVVLPKLLLGSRWSGQNAESSRRTLLVDDVRELVGAEATLFQRMNERGDMLRVATTVRDHSGARAIGTYIPAVEPDERANLVVSTVLRGQTYQGRARVLDRWYLASYEPLRDLAGRVVGMLFIGLRQDSLEGIRSGVAASRIGRSGAIYVLGANGNQRGRYLIAPSGHQDGEDAWTASDASGDAYVQKIIRAALSARAGEAVQTVHVQEPVSGASRERLAAVTYFEPWDWVIVAEMDREEAVAPFRAVQSSLAAAVLMVVAVAVLLLAGTIWAARKAANRIVAPLEGMATAAERIAHGDVQQDVTYRSGDEIGRLAEAFRGTIGYLQEVARGAAALARGDLSTTLVLRSERDELTRSFQSAHSELRRVVEEIRRLTGAAVEGRLSERAAPEGFSGAYRATLEGVNATLDALAFPLRRAGEHFDRIARGDIPAPIAERYPGELDVIRQSINHCIEAVNGLVLDVHTLAAAALEGRLDARADPSTQRGEFRKIIEGVNATLSTLVGHLDAMPAPAMIVGRELDIRYMNQTGASLLGRTQEELVGTKCCDSFRTSDCRTARCACARAMEEDREVSSETDAHPDGLDLEIVYSAVPLHDRAGRVVGAFQVISDQKAVKRAG